jgi:hypothetical protein
MPDCGCVLRKFQFVIGSASKIAQLEGFDQARLSVLNLAGQGYRVVRAGSGRHEVSGNKKEQKGVGVIYRSCASCARDI